MRALPWGEYEGKEMRFPLAQWDTVSSLKTLEGKRALGNEEDSHPIWRSIAVVIGSHPAPMALL